VQAEKLKAGMLLIICLAATMITPNDGLLDGIVGQMKLIMVEYFHP